ncbi:hypothetical protein DB35_02215 [Streptomyces abyssalis]|uniref:GPP34 family phosphoprotein n=1 Tax=Streptomyces abyssalis TaxID=933944 RepID=A0A1E7JPE2_9ACTN|nr:GPP34 family phosphoprotein [Streptomyces abyssalis]OEU90152.1 hypothetical protein AN215_11365 [Streptomyces abyssalis]OEU94885.1 hypothetical protein DB35_02215 [Streptomyces abyssalis]OEV06287.1 hypothetical protein AN219_35115 [Streptomyces nanshensis]
MSTPRDLMIIALDVTPSRPVKQGELSLALAGAELVDLLGAGAVTLEDDLIVPGDGTPVTDPLLERAAASFAREAPHEPVGDWLWRRGRGLASAYLDALQAEGQLTRRRSRWSPFRTGRTVPADSYGRRRAGDRWASEEPVLLALATTVGIRDDETGRDTRIVDDEAVETVLAAVDGASVELEAVRQRRSVEQDAFDNIWRGD